jgi:hypothetical protein
MVSLAASATAFGRIYFLFFSLSWAVIQRTSTARNLLFSHLMLRWTRMIQIIMDAHIFPHTGLYNIFTNIIECGVYIIIRQQANSQCHKTALKSFERRVLQHFDLYTRDALPVEAQSRLRSLTLMTNSLRKTIFTSVRLLGILVCDHQK